MHGSHSGLRVSAMWEKRKLSLNGLEGMKKIEIYIPGPQRVWFLAVLTLRMKANQNEKPNLNILAYLGNLKI